MKKAQFYKSTIRNRASKKLALDLIKVIKYYDNWSFKAAISRSRMEIACATYHDTPPSADLYILSLWTVDESAEYKWKCNGMIPSLRKRSVTPIGTYIAVLVYSMMSGTNTLNERVILWKNNLKRIAKVQRDGFPMPYVVGAKIVKAEKTLGFSVKEFNKVKPLKADWEELIDTFNALYYR